MGVGVLQAEGGRGGRVQEGEDDESDAAGSCGPTRRRSRDRTMRNQERAKQPRVRETSGAGSEREQTIFHNHDV